MQTVGRRRSFNVISEPDPVREKDRDTGGTVVIGLATYPQVRRRQVQSPIPAIDGRFRETLAAEQLAGHSPIGPARLPQGRLGY